MLKKLFLLPFIITALSANPYTNWQEVEEFSKHAVIQVLNHGNRPAPFEPYKRSLDEVTSVGSGFFINKEGEFLTNFHVISNTKRLEVLMPSISRDRFAAELVGCKPERDVALCRLTEKGKKEFEKFLETVPGCNGVIQHLELADDSRLSPAQEIMALGFPLNDGFKRTVGHINGLSLTGKVWCQISAPINHGSSGGPSVNSEGKVIGINSAGRPDASVVGYMAPISSFRNIIDDMRTHRVLTYNFGFSDQRVTKNLLEAHGCPKQGTLVTHVLPNSFAQKNGLQAGDIIMEVNSHAVDRDGMVSVDWIDAKVPASSIFDELSVGDEIILEVWRDGVTTTLTGSMPATSHVTIENSYPEEGPLKYRAFGGIVIQQLNLNHSSLAFNQETRAVEPDLFAFLESFSNRMEQRLVISKLFDCSQAEHEPALHVGAILESVNGQSVRTLEELDTAVASNDSQFLNIKMMNQQVACLHVPTLLEEDADLRELHQYEQMASLQALA